MTNFMVKSGTGSGRISQKQIRYSPTCVYRCGQLSDVVSFHSVLQCFSALVNFILLFQLLMCLFAVYLLILYLMRTTIWGKLKLILFTCTCFVQWQWHIIFIAIMLMIFVYIKQLCSYILYIFMYWVAWWSDLWSTGCEFDSRPCTAGLVLGWVTWSSVGG